MEADKALTHLQPRPPSASAARESLIKEWVFRFQANAGQNLTPEHASTVVGLWTEAFADLTDGTLEAAFRKTICSCTFWPKIADIRQHIERGRVNCAEEEAAQKWQRVRDYIRMHYNPDLKISSGPKICERTWRAINAAGGFAYLSECGKENLVFARKRFIESYLRWQELRQDEYMLPEGKVKKLLCAVAEAKAFPVPQHRLPSVVRGPEGERES